VDHFEHGSDFPSASCSGFFLAREVEVPVIVVRSELEPGSWAQCGNANLLRMTHNYLDIEGVSDTHSSVLVPKGPFQYYSVLALLSRQAVFLPRGFSSSQYFCRLHSSGIVNQRPKEQWVRLHESQTLQKGALMPLEHQKLASSQMIPLSRKPMEIHVLAATRQWAKVLFWQESKTERI
jgi:hypothetical protein